MSTIQWSAKKASASTYTSLDWQDGTLASHYMHPGYPEGSGYPRIDLDLSRVHDVRGAIYRSTQARERGMILRVRCAGVSEYQLSRAKRRLAQILPPGELITLRAQLGSAVAEIDGYVSGMDIAPIESSVGREEDVSIAFTSPDPFWRGGSIAQPGGSFAPVPTNRAMRLTSDLYEPVGGQPSIPNPCTAITPDPSSQAVVWLGDSAGNTYTFNASTSVQTTQPPVGFGVEGMATFNGTIVVAGASQLRAWTGSSWIAIGPATNGTIRRLRVSVSGTRLLVMGDFTAPRVGMMVLDTSWAVVPTTEVPDLLPPGSVTRQTRDAAMFTDGSIAIAHEWQSSQWFYRVYILSGGELTEVASPSGPIFTLCGISPDEIHFGGSFLTVDDAPCERAGSIIRGIVQQTGDGCPYQIVHIERGRGTYYACARNDANNRGALLRLVRGQWIPVVFTNALVRYVVQTDWGVFSVGGFTQRLTRARYDITNPGSAPAPLSVGVQTSAPAAVGWGSVLMRDKWSGNDEEKIARLCLKWDEAKRGQGATYATLDPRAPYARGDTDQRHLVMAGALWREIEGDAEVVINLADTATVTPYVSGQARYWALEEILGA